MFAEAGQSFYAQSQASSGTGGPSGGPTGSTEAGPTAGTAGGKPEDVVEADYEIVDEGKK